MRAPRMPLPVGGAPIAAMPAASIPDVMNSERVPSGAITPSAAYCAPARSFDVSTMRSRVADNERS
ncbi:unannotated protein [freshwater metagenome]|uniref:Unannotated protein n=1 Tax=freshwater metagenome TaxID=449393 RepID=A0A6J6VSP2_9ZZZZ